MFLRRKDKSSYYTWPQALQCWGTLCASELQSQPRAQAVFLEATLREQPQVLAFLLGKVYDEQFSCPKLDSNSETLAKGTSLTGTRRDNFLSLMLSEIKIKIPVVQG